MTQFPHLEHCKAPDTQLSKCSSSLSSKPWVEPLWAMLLRTRPGIPSFAETYQRLQDAQSWPGQDVISRVNALANTIVVSPPSRGLKSLGTLWVTSLHLGFLTYKGDTHLMCLQQLRVAHIPYWEPLRAGDL